MGDISDIFADFEMWCPVCRARSQRYIAGYTVPQQLPKICGKKSILLPSGENDGSACSAVRRAMCAGHVTTTSNAGKRWF